MKRKTAPRKKLKNGRPTVYDAKEEVRAIRRKIALLNNAGNDIAVRKRRHHLAEQLRRAENRVATIDLLRFEAGLKVKLGKIITQTDFLHKLVRQQRNVAVLSEEHRDAAVRVYEEARAAIVIAFDNAMARRSDTAFRPSPLAFKAQ